MQAQRAKIFVAQGAGQVALELVTVLREGYGLAGLRADAVAGITVAIVALPLSMAIAIASGASPERGLYTAIVGGFLVSALGGSRFQIDGPAGAFIVLVAAHPGAGPEAMRPVAALLDWRPFPRENHPCPATPAS